MITVQEIVDKYNQSEDTDLDIYDKMRDLTDFLAEKANEKDNKNELERIYQICIYAALTFIDNGKNDIESMAKFIIAHFDDLRCDAKVFTPENVKLPNLTTEFTPENVKTNDPVNHPVHYTSGKYETIDIIQDKLTEEQFEGFCVGNAIKYITRYKLKGGLEDLEKAIWYLNKIVEVKRGKAE